MVTLHATGGVLVLSTQERSLCYQRKGGFIAAGPVQLCWQGMWTSPLSGNRVITEEPIETLGHQIPKKPYPGLIAVNQASDVT